jgi:hypothetical protein
MLAACGSAAEPTMSVAEVQGTAMAAAMTMVAETQAAIPTATSIPPSATPTATSFSTPTNTVVPLSLESPTPTQAISALPTNTTAPSTGSNDPCLQPLTSWEGDSAQINVKNNTKPKGSIILALGFNTNMGQCGIISASFSNNATLTVPIGSFWASAFVTGKKDFKVFGGDVITRSGNYSLWIENERIILKAGCAPNC